MALDVRQKSNHVCSSPSVIHFRNSFCRKFLEYTCISLKVYVRHNFAITSKGYQGKLCTQDIILRVVKFSPLFQEVNFTYLWSNLQKSMKDGQKAYVQIKNVDHIFYSYPTMWSSGLDITILQIWVFCQKIINTYRCTFSPALKTCSLDRLIKMSYLETN